MASRKSSKIVPIPLTSGERVQIIEQALVLVEQVYVHLPLKRAMHAVEPVQRLKLLKQRLAGLSDREFHDEMISIFTHLRDLHTNYILPEPTTRVGQRSGVLVEDLGITPDEIHRTTKRDVLNNEVDLIERAAEILAKKTVYSLSAEVIKRRVVAKGKNITRVDTLLNDRPYESLDIKRESIRFDLPTLPVGPNVLELRGFHEGKLKVSTRLPL